MDSSGLSFQDYLFSAGLRSLEVKPREQQIVGTASRYLSVALRSVSAWAGVVTKIAPSSTTVFSSASFARTRTAASSFTSLRMIVLTAPRLDPNNPGASWGSLSYKISMLASCPVLLVK
jgi:hypothetical protein